MKVYYNEFDKKKCAALNALMQDGIIRLGDIDDRPIQEVKGYELREYERCHFFAGVGLWDMALDLAGWEEGCRVWTGSCPCQPFSTAGRQKGKTDDRHLWPFWLSLIQECCPPVIFGEQVNAAITHGWLDDVYQGLETEGYAVGSVVLPASAVGAPHRRERLWFVGYAQSKQWRIPVRERQKENTKPIRAGESCGALGYSEHDGPLAGQESGGNGQAIQHHQEGENSTGKPTGTSESSDVADTECKRPSGQGELPGPMYTAESGEREADQSNYDCSGHWQNGEWIDCPDGKQRLIEPRIPLLANGYPERVGVIHCAGDAIVPQVAAEFIRATL